MAQPNSLLANLEAFEIPDMNPKVILPIPEAGQDPRAPYKNTRNMAYPIQTVSYILPWNITNADLRPFLPILHLPYPNDNAPDDCQPLRNRLPATGEYGLPYRHEAGLTSRLDEVFFTELNRRLNFIRWAVDNIDNLLPGKEHLILTPQKLRVLQSEPGSCAQHSKGFLADRCALAERTRGRDMLPQITRCVGEIKPSYKFQGKWGRPREGNYQLGWGQVDQYKDYLVEYAAVLAQVKFYMRNMGDHGDGRVVKYGYIITDNEVVLVRRDGDDLGRMFTTPGFSMTPGRDFPGQEVHGGPQAITSAMTAAVLIHLLASRTDPNLYTSPFED